MTLTRRESLKVLGTASLLVAASPAAAAPPSGPVPIAVPDGGMRLYPSSDADQWWEPQPIINSSWTLPQIIPPTGLPPELVLTGFPTMGAAFAPDGATLTQDIRNAPRHGVFTRMYQQLVTRPLQGTQTLAGTISIAVHAYQAHRRLNAALALQVVVHGSDGLVRGVALPVTAASEKFTTDTPPRTRVLLGAPLSPVPCSDGDVIAINVGIWANNETRSLAPGIGLYFYANQETDIGFVDSTAFANTWVHLSTPPTF